MQDNINKFHKEAFSTPENLQLDVDDSFDKAPYLQSIRTEGLSVNQYTSGDTKYQQEQALPNNYLTTLPSKIARRYSPQTEEQNSGWPIPPDPSFIKNNSHPERIRTIRDLINRKNSDTMGEKSKFTPIPGVDFARTHSDAALFLKKLGKHVSYEAHHSAIKQDTNESNEARITSADRIIVKQLTTSKQNNFDSKIILDSIPEKNYDNINMVAIGHEHSIDSQIKTASKAREDKIKTNKSFIATSKPKPTDTVLLNSVLLNNDDTDSSDIITPPSNVGESMINTNRSQNLVTLVEKKVNTLSSPEITNQDDASPIIRKVIEDFTQMKEEQKKDRQVQMKTVENRIKKIVQSELPEEVETNSDAVSEIREIIREVVESHPNLIQRNNDKDMEFSFAARDTFLRVQIEQELRDKFESRIVDNNKLMEKKSRVMFEEMMHKFLNP